MPRKGGPDLGSSNRPAPPVRYFRFGLAKYRPTHERIHGRPARRVCPRGEGPTSSGFTRSPVGAIMGHARSHPPAEDYPWRDARLWRSRSPGLLLGLQMQPLHDSQRRWLARPSGSRTSNRCSFARPAGSEVPMSGGSSRPPGWARADEIHWLGRSAIYCLLLGTCETLPILP